MTIFHLLVCVFMTAALATLWAIWPDGATPRTGWERARRREEAAPAGRTSGGRVGIKHRVFAVVGGAAARLGRGAAGRVSPKGLESALLRAGIDLAPAEFCVLTLIAVLMGAALGLFWRDPIVALCGAAGGAALPAAWLRLRLQRRVASFERQLPDALVMIAGALRAGQSFLQAVDAVGQQITAPLGPELSRVVQETRVNVPLEDALRRLAARVGSSDLDLVVAAVMVQREAGGNLAQVIERVSQTIRERMRLRGEIRTLTAQGRLSGIIIGSLPLALGMMIRWLNPEYLDVMINSAPGQFMLAVCGVLSVVGFLIIRKLVSVDM